jgi:hypothetical protein
MALASKTVQRSGGIQTFGGQAKITGLGQQATADDPAHFAVLGDDGRVITPAR